MNAVGSIIVIVINQRLIRFGGDLAVGAYGIINRVAMLFAMIVMGLNQGMQPIAGYNFGAGLLDRVGRVLKLTIMVASGIMVVGCLICELFPHGGASVFTTDSELIDLVVPGLRIVMFFFPIVGFQMVTVNFFQSIGMPGKAIFMSLTRQVLFLLPGLIILPLFYGVNGVWYSMPLSDLLSSLISLYMLIVQYRKSVIKSV